MYIYYHSVFTNAIALVKLIDIYFVLNLIDIWIWWRNLHKIIGVSSMEAGGLGRWGACHLLLYNVEISLKFLLCRSKHKIKLSFDSVFYHFYFARSHSIMYVYFLFVLLVDFFFFLTFLNTIIDICKMVLWFVIQYLYLSLPIPMTMYSFKCLFKQFDYICNLGYNPWIHGVGYTILSTKN